MENGAEVLKQCVVKLCRKIIFLQLWVYNL